MNPKVIASGERSVTNGFAIDIVVTLSGPAPAGSVNVLLSASPKGPVALEQTVKVEAGSNYAISNDLANIVTEPTNVTITAALSGSQKSAQVTVKPFTISAFTVSPVSVTGGTSSPFALICPSYPSGIDIETPVGMSAIFMGSSVMSSAAYKSTPASPLWA